MEIKIIFRSKFKQGTESFKTLMKEIEDDTNKWTDIYICRLEDLIMLTCLYFPKQSANSMQSPIKIPISSSQL